MIRRKRDSISNAPATVDNADGNLGIRKPSHGFLPLVSPSSPQTFFQRISPSLRRTGNKNKYAGTSYVPLGIEPSPFLHGTNVVSPRQSPSQKPSPTASTVDDSDDENPYRISTAILEEDAHLIDDHLFTTVSACPQSNPENDELSAHSSIVSHHAQPEITLDRKGGVEFRMRNRDNTQSSSLLQAPTNLLSQPDMVVTPTKDALQQTLYRTPPAKDDVAPLESARSFSLRRSPKDTSPHNDNNNTAEEKQQQRSSKSSSKIRIKEPRISLSGKKKFTSIHVNEIVKDSVTDEPLIKLFLLLLQPKAKIFELIQLYFPPSVTTVGDIIHLIPANATEKALGSQKYIGLCRPRRRSSEYTNLSVMASGTRNSMGITQGEILIAIPETFAARYMIGISKQILSNPRIRMLLEKSASSLKSGGPMEVVQEEPEASSTDVEHILKRAQQFPDNASPSVSRDELLTDYGDCRTPEDRFNNFNGSYTDNTLADVSLQGSYDSWSRSFDSSVNSVARSTFVVEPLVSSSSTPRRRKKRFSAATKVMGAVVLYMIVRFCLDTSVTPKTSPSDVLGMAGFLQFVFCLISLAKWQRYKQRKVKKQPSRCPFIQHMKD